MALSWIGVWWHRLTAAWRGHASLSPPAPMGTVSEQWLKAHHQREGRIGADRTHDQDVDDQADYGHTTTLWKSR
jgi:hypothetical protein